MSFEEFIAKYHIRLNDQQMAAVKTINGPTLLLAVPGSGKTTVLVTRIGYMLYCCGIEPRSILTVTYTKAAAEDMKKRFIKFFGDKYADELTFCTINSLSNRIMNHFAYCVGKQPFKVADKEAIPFVKAAFQKVTGEFANENDVKAVQTAITYVKNMEFTPEEIRTYETDVEEFPRIFAEYNRILKDNSMIDYDDQMVYALKILQTSHTVLSHYTDRYKYVCVDEAQDTSKIQHTIIHTLVKANNNIFMVGDEDQSIYGFRAAYPKALTEFEKTYQNANVLLMESNYRSRSEIVKAADKLIQTNIDRHKKHVLSTRSDGGVVNVTRISKRKEQYSMIAENLKNLPGSVAVLYRNTESALPLIDLLDRYKISYKIRQGDGTFFTHPVVLDILDILNFSRDMTNTELFMKIYYKIGAYLNKQLATEACASANGGDILYWFVRNQSLPRYVSKRCKEIRETMLSFKNWGAGTAIYKVLNSLNYRDYMTGRGVDSGKADILQILGDAEPNFDRFFKRLDELHELVTSGVENDSRLTLSTIHSSKGLEFDSVYMIDMLKNVLPGCDKPTSANDKTGWAMYEEEKRLYYVGMTRAKENLYIFSFDQGRTSDFTNIVFDYKQLFASKPTPKAKYSTVNIPVNDPSAQAMSDSEYERIKKSMIPGAKVVHQTFGPGTVASQDGNKVDVNFDNGKTRSFQMTIAIQMGMLTLVQ